MNTFAACSLPPGDRDEPSSSPETVSVAGRAGEAAALPPGGVLLFDALKRKLDALVSGFAELELARGRQGLPAIHALAHKTRGLAIALDDAIADERARRAGDA